MEIKGLNKEPDDNGLVEVEVDLTDEEVTMVEQAAIRWGVSKAQALAQIVDNMLKEMGAEDEIHPIDTPSE